ncbi:type ISP restriction/modification enzyme [Myroides sp. LJL116]
MNTLQYITNLNNRFKLGNSTEHTFRGDLQYLIESLLPSIQATNEPKRQACGAPDYVLTKIGSSIPIGYIEAKDIGVDLKSKQLQGQFGRYKEGLTNLIITDYLKFDFYRDGELTTSITIGEIVNGTIKPIHDNIPIFDNLIRNFSTVVSQTIRSAERLAELLAGKARLMADIIEKALNADDELQLLSPLKQQMLSFKNMLIHDIDNKAFSDIYSQTIAYGMFAARYNDTTLGTFSRMEAANLIPKSNPFLRKLFQDIAGFDLDSRIDWVVDELVNVFLATDVHQIMKGFGKSTNMEDPIIHFYETFLSKYDAKLRKARGVWYTPQPVVNFIVRAVDDILKDEFDLPLGLTDTSKIKIDVDTQVFDKKKQKYKQGQLEVHRVQILDPATGTGTFLAETVKQIFSTFKGMEGVWTKYVEKDLIPRLNGFELLMASYAMAHLKMDMLLQETGYKSNSGERFRIFLTNSLEKEHKDTGTLFSSWLSEESNQANFIKKNTPVMVVMGNPPYAVSSTNKSTWIQDLLKDYKKNLNERKLNLDDDYIKFIRYGQYFVDKRGSGVLAYITNNSFIDGITHRQMRKSLLESFDKIYIMDLHGNTMKKEVAEDGSVDQNVFDIQQGVSINILIKNGNKDEGELAKVFHLDVYGKRDFKYNLLNEATIRSLKWNELTLDKTNFFFTKKDFSLSNEYNLGIKLDLLFQVYNSGIQTKCDVISVNSNKSELVKTKELFTNSSIDELKQIFNKTESTGWNFVNAKNDIVNNKSEIIRYNYRPLDFKYIIYTESSSGFLGRPRLTVMKHLLKENLGLCLMRQFFQAAPYSHVYVTNSLIDERTMYSNRGGTYLFPLYLYNDTNQITFEETSIRSPNLNTEIVTEIEIKLGLHFTNEKENTAGTFAPVDVLDYVYAVLNSPKYRDTYKEFLKIDFPRVPYPYDSVSFWKLVDLGKQIRVLHLLESDKINNFISSYPESGDNIVVKPVFKGGKVFINDTQYFTNVPEVAWSFYLGGYQPAQKWLKDRKGIELSFDDIRHYNQMIVVLVETDRLMKEIDNVITI